MSARIAFVVLIVLLMTSSVASAGSVDLSWWGPKPHTLEALLSCSDDKFYDAQSTGAPAPIAAALSGTGRALTFRTCTDFDGDLHYFMRSLLRNPGGVCRVGDDELFVGRKADDFVVLDYSDEGKEIRMAGWTDQEPDDWHKMGYDPGRMPLALLVDPAMACPSVSDPHYIEMRATDGTFRGFMRLWREATATRASFNRVFGAVTVRDADIYPDVEGERESLREWVFKEHAPIRKIDCTHGVPYGQGCAAYIGVVSIQFDLGDSGRLEIINIGDSMDGPLW